MGELTIDDVREALKAVQTNLSRLPEGWQQTNAGSLSIAVTRLCYVVEDLQRQIVALATGSPVAGAGEGER